MRNLDEIQRAVDAGMEMFGRLDIVSVNAEVARFHSTGHARIGVGLGRDTNLKGVCATCKAVVPAVIESGTAAPSS